MDVYIIQKNGYNGLCSCDEFGEVTNNLVDKYGYKSRSRGCLRTQDEYILVVNAALRDREFEEIYREFMKWFVRLCKRVGCEDVLVEIKGYNKSTVIKDRNIQRKSIHSRVFSMAYLKIQAGVMVQAKLIGRNL